MLAKYFVRVNNQILEVENRTLERKHLTLYIYIILPVVTEQGPLLLQVILGYILVIIKHSLEMI